LLPHALRQIAVRRLDLPVVVITHQAIGMSQPIQPFDDLLEHRQEQQPVINVFKDQLMGVASFIEATP
jgi:hypothetical protein